MSRVERMELEHRRFGHLELSPDEVIRFGGIPGFPSADRFILLRHDRASAFLWLVCLDVEDLAFAVTDPRQFFPFYEPVLGESQLRALGAVQGDLLEVFAIATLGDGQVTLNLAAPLVLNPAKKLGTQAILDEPGAGTRVPLPALRPASSAEAGPRGAAQMESKPQR